MKEILSFLKNGFVNDFLKMDKNKCPKLNCKNRLTNEKKYLEKKILSSQIKRPKLFFIMIIFKYFYKKGFRDLFCSIILEWKLQ